jgi:hypothetical protein
MNKAYSPIEINFETGQCEETLESSLIYSINQLQCMPNPYVGNKRKILFDIVSILEKNNIRYDKVFDMLFSFIQDLSINI